MYSSKKSQEFPITITYCTKNHTLYQEKANSNEKFSSILEKFEKNILYKNDAKLKSKYYINGREIRKAQLLQELVKQNSSQPLNNEIDNAELSIELEDLCYNGDASYQNYEKIIFPKSNPISLYIYSPKENIINLQNIPEKNINLFELNKFNEGSAYCNGYNELYISGGNDNNKDFWMINNSNYEIKKKNMLSNKKNHSMIYINFKEENEWVFIAGGEDTKTFYYDIKKNYFINWGNSLETHIKPALIQVGEYLYIFDEINNRKNFFERTKIIEPTRKWEKIVPNFDKKIMANFPSKFGVSFDSDGKILLLGGNNIETVNDTYIYEPGSNTIVLSKNGTNDNMLFNDKTFYKVSKRYSINIPQNLNEVKEIGVSDKQSQSLIKLSLDIVSDDKYNVTSKLSFVDKIQYNNKDNGNITIKASYKEIKQDKFSQQNKYNQNYDYNQSQNQPIDQLICDDCLQNNTFICQCCHNSFQKKYPDFIPTRENPRVTIIQDEYYPTLSKAYIHSKNRGRDKPKVEITYDEYTPIKVDYELQKPGVTIKKYLYVKKSKEEIRKNEEENQIKKEENIIEQKQQENLVHNEEPQQNLQNVQNDQNVEKEENIEHLQEEENAQIEQNEQREPSIEKEENKENPQNEGNIQNVENGLKEDNENISQNAQDDKNNENDEVEYKNYENNEQENRDDDIFIENEQNHQNDVIIEENQNHYESNYNEDIEVQPDQEQNNNIPEEEGEDQGQIKNKSEENNDQIEHKEEFISMEEENMQHIDNSEEHKEPNEIQHIENIEDDDKEGNNAENNNIVSQNKDKEIINGELPKDSLEFNDNVKIHEDENDLKPQHELDFNNQEINNQNEIQKPGLGEEQAHEEHIENKNEINIEENKNGENDNIILDGEEFHSMEEVEGQNNSVQHNENGNNEEMYENGKEIKFEGEEENENENGNENNIYNGEENLENIKDEDENKILEYEGEGLEGEGEGEGEGEADVEEIEVHEEKKEGGEMNGEEGMEEGEEMHNEEGMEEGEGEEMHNEEGMEEGEGEEMHYEEGMEEGEEMNYEEGMEEGEEMNYEEGNEEGEEMNYEEGMEEGEEMNFGEGEGEEGEGNYSVFENNEDNEEHEHDGNNEGDGNNNGES
jgi:hypothetical protein